MQTIKYEGWLNISIPDNWINQDENDLLSFYGKDGIGSIQISCYKLIPQVEDVSKKLEDVTESYINKKSLNKENINLEYFNLNDNKVSRLEFIEEERYWLVFHILNKTKFLFITYNCLEENKNIEMNITNQIINSIEFID